MLLETVNQYRKDTLDPSRVTCSSCTKEFKIVAQDLSSCEKGFGLFVLVIEEIALKVASLSKTFISIFRR